MSIIIGIDPGTHTGVAVWDFLEMKFLQLSEMPIHRAMNLVSNRVALFGSVPVLFEDARQRTWFGHSGREKLQGAGAAKRDASIWEDFLVDTGTPYIARCPSAGSTKWPADKFQRVTGWPHRTNGHARDAGVLVYGIRQNEISGIIRSWELNRASQAARTSARR